MNRIIHLKKQIAFITGLARTLTQQSKILQQFPQSPRFTSIGTLLKQQICTRFMSMAVTAN